MVEAKFYCGKESIHMQLTGHAGAAPKGKDLVCAGVSTLAATLGSAVERMYEQGMLRRCPKVELAEGCAEIIAVPREENREAVLMAFWTVQMGIGTLAEGWPECVQMWEVLRAA